MTTVRARIGFFAKFRSLKPVGRWMLIEATFLLPLTALALRLFGLRCVHSVMNWLAKRSHRKAPQDPTRHVRKTRHIIRYLRRNGPFRGNCLSRSLLLWYLLQCNGIQSNLQIGVRREEDLFLAHAWVEFQGHPLNAQKGIRDLYAAFDEAIQPRRAWFQ